MRKFLYKLAILVVPLTLVATFICGSGARAQTINLDVSSLIPRVEVSFSPRSGSFVEQSVFNVPIFINTKNARINGIDIKVNFDKDKLEIVKPSSDQSLIGVWVEPPSYDNTRGTASYVGVIPNGIMTSSGLIGTITFRAKSIGHATVSFSQNSKVLLNDGQGSEATVDFGRAEYTILPKAPEGVNIFSETHPFQNEWYANNSPVVSWERDPGVSGFSYAFDNKPNTIPENVVNATSTSVSFENLDNGLWYFHIKAIKNGAWGTTGNFLMRIDTVPPADFTPEIDYLMASTLLTDRALVSFFTTDNLSGVDHYEVGVIDRTQPGTISPIFVQAESPFQVPLTSDNLTVIVRAMDKAGNVRDVSIAVGPPSLVGKFLKDNLVYILLLIIVIGLIAFIFQYIVGHHIIRRLRIAAELAERERLALDTPIYKLEQPHEINGHYTDSR